jgi:hypothetical protein
MFAETLNNPVLNTAHTRKPKFCNAQIPLFWHKRRTIKGQKIWQRSTKPDPPSRNWKVFLKIWRLQLGIVHKAWSFFQSALFLIPLVYPLALTLRPSSRCSWMHLIQVTCPWPPGIWSVPRTELQRTAVADYSHTHTLIPKSCLSCKADNSKVKQSTRISRFTGPQGSLSCSPEPATRPYPETYKCCPYPPILFL